ncbi:hypothetical protein U9K52_20830 [Chryseobacterium sp. MHB01]|jgi:hypothetical protein|uniref:hypothetical protein n=1 Tax=unclassified Chryseobacterium TaxID=2593645 RepID=UPI002896452E|nr:MULTISPECIES: hypothetical protein [unclassified Chryseobacterium]MEA1851370.1 hypothetical protein [Chryseobacterium sp. MHB01]
MKNNIFYILIFIAAYSCTKERNIVTPISISVQHPNHSFFENRDARYLTVKDLNGNNISKMRLRDNVDSEAKSYLFKPTNDYIVVDCDGAWYHINSKTGLILKDKSYDPWTKKKLPQNYIGTFIQKKTQNIYFLKKENKIDLTEVYKYGGGSN